MTDDTESNPPPAGEPSPADVAEVQVPQVWERERARQNLLDLMLDGRSTGGQRHFVTGDGVVSYQPLHEDMRLVTADALRAKAAQPDEHPHIADWYTKVAQSLEADHAQAKDAAEEAKASAAASGTTAPSKQFAEPTPERRSTFLPFVTPRGSDKPELGIPRAVLDAWHTVKRFVEHGYDPGTGDEEGARNAAGTALVAAGGMTSPKSRTAAGSRAAGPAEKTEAAGPWEQGWDQGKWRDANPTAQEQAPSVRSYRERQSRPIEKEPEPGALDKLKEHLQTPEGLAAGVTATSAPVAFKVLHDEARDQKEAAAPWGKVDDLVRQLGGQDKSADEIIAAVKAKFAVRVSRDHVDEVLQRRAFRRSNLLD